MNPIDDLKLMLKYRRIIKELKPKAVLSYTIKPNVYGGIACRLTGTPLIANVTGLGDAIENGGWLQKLAVSLYKAGVVKYLCTTSDVRPYIGNVHCTIMPSYHEGMSNVNLESAANGRPVITTDVPGCRETVDDGITGFLVKSKDSIDLIEKVKGFINLSHEEKEAMGYAAREKVEREFDRNIVVQAYLKEIKSI